MNNQSDKLFPYLHRLTENEWNILHKFLGPGWRRYVSKSTQQFYQTFSVEIDKISALCTGSGMVENFMRSRTHQMDFFLNLISKCVQSWKISRKRENPFWCAFSNFPVNLCWRPCWFFLYIKRIENALSFTGYTIATYNILSKADSQNLHTVCWTLVVR